MAIIEIEGLHKSYGSIKALRNLDLSVAEGEIYGFLGPNGAGKTTAIKIIMSLLNPDVGRIRVKGIDVTEAGPDIRKYIGYLPERVALYEYMTVQKNLEFLCDLKGCPRDVIPHLLDDFKIKASKDTKVKTLSKGMLQRLGLAQTQIGDPDVLILDEPTSGLDPEIRRWVKKKIISMKKKGKTVFLSSHVLSEVQEICDRVGVISDGKLIAEDTVKNLSEKLHLEPRIEISVDPIDEALKHVKSLKYIHRPRIEKELLVLYCTGKNKARLIHDLVDQGMEIDDVGIEEPDLEEVFVKIMEGEI